MDIFEWTTRHEILGFLWGPSEMIEVVESAIVDASTWRKGVVGPRAELKRDKGIRPV